MNELKPYDKVTVKGWHGELTVFEFAKTMAIVTDKFGTYHACNIQDMRKVEEKKAPPKFTKVYVWDGDEKPDAPCIRYSFGGFFDGRLKICGENNFKGCEDRWYAIFRNWEVI